MEARKLSLISLLFNFSLTLCVCVCVKNHKKMNKMIEAMGGEFFFKFFLPPPE